MKRKFFLVLLLCNLLLLQGLYCADIGEVITLKGKAIIIRAADDSEADVVKGTKIFKGDKIKTFFASSAMVKLNDNSTINIKPGTTMDFTDVKKTSSGDKKVKLNLWFGKSRLKVPKMKGLKSSFSVKTPTAVAGVRGTDFALGVNPAKSTYVGVFSGAVGVKSNAGGAEVLVKKNQSTVVEANKPASKPTTMTDDEKEEWSTGVEEEAPTEEEDEMKEGELIKLIGSSFPSSTNEKTIKIRGQVLSGVKVLINDEEIALSGNSFERTIMLIEGKNELIITAIGPDSNKQEIEKEIILDSIPPSYLQIIRPRNFDYGSPTPYNKRYLPIIGFTDKGNKIKIDNKPVELDSRGQFRLNMPLNNGINRIKIEIEDEAGNTFTRYSGAFNVDFVPPHIYVTSPISSAEPTQNELITISGTTESNAKVYIRIDGKIVEEFNATGGVFSTAVSLSEGSHIIAVQAEDAAGNRSMQVQRTVVIDKTAPELTGYYEVVGNNLRCTLQADEQLKEANLSIPSINVNKSISDASVSTSGRYYFYVWNDINLIENPSFSGVMSASGKDLAGNYFATASFSQK